MYLFCNGHIRMCLCIVLRFAALVDKIIHYFDVKIAAYQITCVLHVMRYIIPNHYMTGKCGTMGGTLSLFLVWVMKAQSLRIKMYCMYLSQSTHAYCRKGFSYSFNPTKISLCGKERMATLILQPGTRIFVNLRGMYV